MKPSYKDDIEQLTQRIMELEKLEDDLKVIKRQLDHARKYRWWEKDAIEELSEDVQYLFFRVEKCSRNI